MLQSGSSSIYHDLDKNKYYRINKQTGEVQRSHKDGSLLKSFKVDITGSDYKIRKAVEESSKNYDSPSIIKKKQKQSRQVRLAKQSVPFSSAKVFSRNYLDEKEMHKDNRKNKNQDSLLQGSGVRARSQIGTSLNSRFMTSIQPEEATLTRHKSNIGSLLDQFSKIKRNNVFQNHSNRHKDAGVVIQQPMLNSRGFRQTQNDIHQPVLNLDKIKKLTRAKIPRPTDRNKDKKEIKGQLSRQKKLFLEFHPIYEERENVRLLNEQIERKKNIKKLEQLFLEQTSKITNQVYS